jgi:hypothetical protein
LPVRWKRLNHNAMPNATAAAGKRQHHTAENLFQRKKHARWFLF